MKHFHCRHQVRLATEGVERSQANRIDVVEEPQQVRTDFAVEPCPLMIVQSLTLRQKLLPKSCFAVRHRFGSNLGSTGAVTSRIPGPDAT